MIIQVIGYGIGTAALIVALVGYLDRLRHAKGGR